MKLLALLCFVQLTVDSLSAQELQPTQDSSGHRCQTGCFRPRRCRRGYFESFFHRNIIFPYCCGIIRVDYSTQTRHKVLDCRSRNPLNLGGTAIDKSTTEIDLSFSRLQNRTEMIRDNFLQYFNNLVYLKIGTAAINTLTDNFLEPFKDLREVDFEFNNIEELPEKLFHHNTKLESVGLNGNRIMFLPDNLFKNNPNIHTLKVSGNSLLFLTSRTLRYLPELGYFDAHANIYLECISNKVFENNTYLAYVNLENIGFRVPGNLQKRYCPVGCRKTVSHLKLFLPIYGWTECPPEEAIESLYEDI